jgi:DNA-binding HxlR family transcriptional regulator
MPANLRSHCPINFSLEVFGDKWSLLILRDIIFRGKRRYSEFLKSDEGFATNILAARLEHLENEGILKSEADPEDARKKIFSMTEKGFDLMPLLFEMILWSAKYDPKSEAKQITQLVELIRKDNRSISQAVSDRIREGKSVFPKYLDSSFNKGVHHG